MSPNPHLVSPADLAEELGQDDLSIIDASWYLPAQNRKAREEFLAGHVPGAVFFDQDEIVEAGSALPHTLPSADRFGQAVGALGVRETDRIVVYDGIGLFSAARVWWMFRTFGAKDVRVLDGGMPAWVEAQLPVETGPEKPEPRRFEASLRREAVLFLDDMRRLVEEGNAQVVDVRPVERFAGEVEEPRPGVRAGHMPGARNLPFLDLVRDGRLKPEAELMAEFEKAGIDPFEPVVTSCGSGVTAAVLNLALESVGSRQSRLYDGSWTEWGSAADTPVVTGR